MAEKKEQETTRKLSKKRIVKLKAYQTFFTSEYGKQVLWDMIAAHHVMSSTFVKLDPLEMAMREGERNVILRILTILKTKPEKLTKLLEEADAYQDQNFMG